MATVNTATLTLIVTGLVSGVALLFSVYSYLKIRRATSYSDLDAMYLEVLKLGLQFPEFRDSRRTSTYRASFSGAELFRYDTYAFICWNLCESIYDREDAALSETWRPVIGEENRLHRAWFDQEENHGKFKQRFCKFVERELPREAGLQGSRGVPGPR